MEGKGEVVVITGCSKGGIGYELCKAFVNNGCRVFATSRNVNSMDGLPELGIHVEEMDVTKNDSISRAIDAIISKAGCIDILVNNAGIGCSGPLSELPLEKIKNNFETNVFGLLAVIQAVVPYMASQKYGKIVNFGSVVGWIATPWGGSYCATKSAVHSLTHTLRMELKPFGIKVMLVVPGAIKSNIGANNLQSMDLSKLSLFKRYEQAIKARATASQSSKSTPTDLFASVVAKKTLLPTPPLVFAYGYYSTFFWLVSFLPQWIRDWCMESRHGLS